MKEAFKKGFSKGATGLYSLEDSFNDIWSYMEQTVFNKPEWKPYLESAKRSYHFCFENGFALGQTQGTLVDEDTAFKDWIAVNFGVGEDMFSLVDEGIMIKVKKDKEHLQTAIDFLNIYLKKISGSSIKEQKGKQKKEDTLDV